MVTIHILSDLHLEAPKSYDVSPIVPTSPYLALLGDIECVKHDEWSKERCGLFSPSASDAIHSNSSISSGFASDLSNELCWTSEKVTTWAFGHTHFNCDFVEDGSRKQIVTNQRGYYLKPAAGFNGQKRIRI